MLRIALATCTATVTLAAAETLVEHEYGLNHKQLDDGYPYEERPVVAPTDPSFAQGYFLKNAAEGPDNARCLDGTPALYYHRKGTGSGANKCTSRIHGYRATLNLFSTKHRGQSCIVKYK